MGRSRSRSRDRSRSSRRDRSRSRSRDRRERDRDRDRNRRSPPRRSRTPPRPALPPSGIITPIMPGFTDVGSIQAMAALQQQQQLQRQLLQQQMLLQTQTAGNSSHQERLARKQREIYVGNLAVGVVNVEMLRELFNAVLAQMVPDPVTTPPVVDVRVDPSGRFGFVELRTHELSDAAIQLDKLEVCGRKLNVARPKDYVDVRTQMAPAQKISAAQMFAASLSAAGGTAAPAGLAAPAALAGGVPVGVAGVPLAAALPSGPGGATNVVMLDNLLQAGRVRNESERRELYEDVLGEASVCGAVLGIAIPIPPLSVPDHEPCRVYIRYGNPLDTQKCMRRMDGRSFEENKVKAMYVSELDFGRAQAGEWIVQHNSAALSGLPAGYPSTALPPPPTR